MKTDASKLWSPAEDQIIRENYKKIPYAQMSLLLPNRKVKAIVNRAYRLKIGYRTDLWQPEEEKALRDAYGNNRGKKTGWHKELARSMGRHPSNLVRKAIQLGIETDDRRRRGIRSPIALAKEERGRWTTEQWKEFRQGQGHLGKEALKRKHGLITDDEWSIWFGKFMEKLHATVGHPRGMLGKSHSLEVRKRMSEWRTGRRRPPFSEEHRQKMSVAASERLRMNPYRFYSRSKSGKRSDIGDTYFRSAYEANYARFLNWQKIRWEYEVKTFWFEKIKRGTRSYTPDFWLPDEGVFHEVKGWMDPKSITRMGRMALYHPEVKVVIIGGDFFKDVEKKRLCLIIPGWECSHNKKSAIEISVLA